MEIQDLLQDLEKVASEVQAIAEELSSKESELGRRTFAKTAATNNFDFGMGTVSSSSHEKVNPLLSFCLS